MLFFYQTIIKFPWWSTMSRNSTIMLTHYAWPPNPLFDAIEFISTGSRSLLVYFCFFFFKKLWIQKFFSIDCRGFFPREIRPRILSLRFGVNTLANKWNFVTQIPSMPSNHFKFKTVSDWSEVIMSYKGLWTNQDSVRNDSVVKQDLILKKI